MNAIDSYHPHEVTFLNGKLLMQRGIGLISVVISATYFPKAYLVNNALDRVVH